MRKRFLVPTEYYEYAEPEPVRLAGPTVTLSGMVTIQLIEAKTGRIKESHTFPNMIPTAFLDRIGGHWQTTIADYRTYMAVGESGLGTSPSQSVLILELSPRTNSDGGFGDSTGYVTASVGAEGGSGSYYFHKRTRLFTELQANGNVREMGMSHKETGGNMLFRTLVKDDATGLPITIVKTNLDQLRIDHEIRLYPPTHDDVSSGTFVLAEVSYSYTASALDVDKNYRWGYGAIGYYEVGMLYGLGRWNPILRACSSCSAMINITGSWENFQGQAGGTEANSSSSYFPYISGSNYLDIQSVFEPSVANFGPGGIKGFVYGWCTGEGYGQDATWQILVDPAIPKTGVDKFKITLRSHFSASTL